MRRLILLVIGGTLLVMVIIIVAGTRGLLLDSFARLERRYVERDVERATNAVSDELTSLGGTANDWATWDDLYAFDRGGNRQVVEKDIDEDFFVNMRLSIVLLMDTQGRVIFGHSFDPARRVREDAPAGLVSWLSTRPAFWRFADTKASAQGIVRIPEGALLAVSRPVRNSLGQGPSTSSRLD